MIQTEGTMALEIEHKFLLKNQTWRQSVEKTVDFKQGYLVSDQTRSVRIRVSDHLAWLNIKSATIGNHRHEYEYPIPLEDGLEILQNLCGATVIEKKRHYVTFESHVWEIDEFLGANAGLIVAEIELKALDETFARPDWLGEEVTDDIKYYNNQLASNPYCNWVKTEST